jgi:hypothetical protein
MPPGSKIRKISDIRSTNGYRRPSPVGEDQILGTCSRKSKAEQEENEQSGNGIKSVTAFHLRTLGKDSSLPDEDFKSKPTRDSARRGLRGCCPDPRSR